MVAGVESSERLLSSLPTLILLAVGWDDDNDDDDDDDDDEDDEDDEDDDEDDDDVDHDDHDDENIVVKRDEESDRKSE